MRKSLRYLRITWTAFCGIACVLLILLWVRSYWIGDSPSLKCGSRLNSSNKSLNRLDSFRVRRPSLDSSEDLRANVGHVVVKGHAK